MYRFACGGNSVRVSSESWRASTLFSKRMESLREPGGLKKGEIHPPPLFLTYDKITLIASATSKEIMDASAQASTNAPAYALSGGGRASPRRRKKSPTTRRAATTASPKKAGVGKIYEGPNGGKYILRKGRKIYL